MLYKFCDIDILSALFEWSTWSNESNVLDEWKWPSLLLIIVDVFLLEVWIVQSNVACFNRKFILYRTNNCIVHIVPSLINF